MSFVDTIAAPFGGFSKPKQTACLSHGVPNKYCYLGTVLRSCENSVCSKCYAGKGRYRMPCTKAANLRRWEYVKAMEFDAMKRILWVDKLAWAISLKQIRTQEFIDYHGKAPKIDGRYFRWFDTGDLQGEYHLSAILRIVELTPDVQHFIPTKEAFMVRRVLDYYGDRGWEIPENFVIRFGAHYLDEDNTILQKRIHERYREQICFSRVFTKENEPRPEDVYADLICPVKAGNQKTCADCRACWSRHVETVHYQLK